MSGETFAPAVDISPAAAPDRFGRRLSLGVSGLYLALYLHYGFFAFIPLWLKEMGAPPAEIGILLAIPLVLRILTVAPFSAWAGRRGQVRNSIAVTSVLSAALISLLLLQPDHIGRIAVVVVFSMMWDQIPVLTDAYAVIAVRSRALDFGRMRVWGAIGVVVSTASAGWIYGFTGILALPLIVALLLLLPAAVAPFLAPDRQMASAEAGTGGRWRDVVGDRKLMRAMGGAAMIMGSHGVLTSFGAIQWNAQGISTGMIGTLQAVAVSAEILAFWFGSKLLGRRDPSLLICIAAGAAMLRWLVMATNPGIGVLFATQLLHGVTSTGAILGTMLVIAARVPVQTSAAAQGLNAVLLGLALAIVTAGSGLLWSYGISAAYLAMAVLAALGVVLAWPSQTHKSSQQISKERNHDQQDFAGRGAAAEYGVRHRAAAVQRRRHRGGGPDPACGAQYGDLADARHGQPAGPRDCVGHGCPADAEPDAASCPAAPDDRRDAGGDGGAAAKAP